MSSNPTWSPQQDKALKAIGKWFDEATAILKRDGCFKNFGQQVFILNGYAGTGKTTLANHMEQHVNGLTLYAAFTGKAALRISQAGCKGASTIHSLIYSPLDNEDRGNSPIFELNENSRLRKAKLLVLDEHSMVNGEIGNDLLSFNVPILALGDPAQLTPVKGTGFFSKRKANVTLTEVHRQALDSPIIQIATDIREGKSVSRFCSDDGSVMAYPMASKFNLSEHIGYNYQLLTGKNVTRRRLNIASRKSIFTNAADNVYPQKNDLLICLRNNNRMGLFNGLMGYVKKVYVANDNIVKVSLSCPDIDREYDSVDIHSKCFSDPESLKQMSWKDRMQMNEFDFGYCITVHKAQGSEWDDVIVCDDGFLNWDLSSRKQWLYTAVTRASKKLVIVRGSRA